MIQDGLNYVFLLLLLKARHGFLEELDHNGVLLGKLFALPLFHALDVRLQCSLDDGQSVLLRRMLIQPLGVAHHRPSSSLWDVKNFNVDCAIDGQGNKFEPDEAI